MSDGDIKAALCKGPDTQHAVCKAVRDALWDVEFGHAAQRCMAWTALQQQNTKLRAYWLKNRLQFGNDFQRAKASWLRETTAAAAVKGSLEPPETFAAIKTGGKGRELWRAKSAADKSRLLIGQIEEGAAAWRKRGTDPSMGDHHMLAGVDSVTGVEQLSPLSWRQWSAVDGTLARAMSDLPDLLLAPQLGRKFRAAGPYTAAQVSTLWFSLRTFLRMSWAGLQ